MFHNRRIGQTKASNDSTKDKQSDDVVAEELSLLSTPETRNINALLHALNEPPGLKVKTEVRPTELTITHNGVTPLGELPDAPDRDYKALIKLKDVTVTFDPQGDQSRTLLPYNKTKATSIMAFIDAWIKVIPTWEVRLWNDARQPSEEEREYLYMFPEIVHITTTAIPKASFPSQSYQSYGIGGPLDINVCPSESEALKVAQEACRLLNKIPFHIDAAHFPEFQPIWRVKASKIRQLLELMSMSVLQDGKFDFRGLRPILQSNATSPSAYCISPLVNPFFRSYAAMNQSVGWEFLAPTFVLNSTGKTREGSRLRFTLHAEEESYPSEFLDDLPDVPPWWGIRPTTPSEDDISPESKVSTSRMMGLVDHISKTFFGHIGSSANLHQTVRDLALPNKASISRVRNRAGPLEGRALFAVQQTMGRVCTSTWLADTIEGTVPAFYNPLPIFALAMTLQRASEVYKSNRGILRTIAGLCIALDEFSHGRKQVLDLQTYCKCENDPTCRSTTHHYCMICLRFETCSAMSWHDDGRLICRSYFLSPQSADVRLVGRNLHMAMNQSVDGLSFAQRHAMFDYLVKNCISGRVMKTCTLRTVYFNLGLEGCFGSLSTPSSLCSRLQMGLTGYTTLRMLDSLQSSTTSSRVRTYP